MNVLVARGHKLKRFSPDILWGRYTKALGKTETLAGEAKQTVLVLDSILGGQVLVLDSILGAQVLVLDSIRL